VTAHRPSTAPAANSDPTARPDLEPTPALPPADPRPVDATPDWKALVARHQAPSRWRASWQLVNTIGGYGLSWVLLHYSLAVSWWLTLPLTVLAAGFLVRTFILFHDCGHGSFFASPRANAFWGLITGLLTWTPYYHWRGDHATHHGCTGNLDRRGVGDLWTMTVAEYIGTTRWRRFAYRLSRNPLVLFVVAPLVMMVVLQRVPRRDAAPRERRSVWTMNLAIAGLVTAMSLWFGFVDYMIVQMAILLIAGAVGIWLFYVQHQFEHAYWEREGDWDYQLAALRGSSYFRLPRVLQWFTGNIGFHHIHHLSPRIPNYRLEACHRSDPLFHAVRAIGIWQAVRTLSLRLWDESSKRLVGWRHVRKMKAGRERPTAPAAAEPRA
jgi:omega-6 fatty acid desaturase (delta-12 desaturase)